MCRGFNEVTSANGIYYQLWQNDKPTINTGATGLQNFGASVGCLPLFRITSLIWRDEQIMSWLPRRQTVSASSLHCEYLGTVGATE